MKKYYCIYMHTFPNGKKYIGMTSQGINRRSRNDGSGYKQQNNLNKAIERYGWKNVKHEILEINLTKLEAERKEYEYIKKYKTNEKEFGYNIANGGHDEKSFSEETKNKIRKSHLGIKFSEERKRNISKALKGRNLSEEHKIKIGISKKGNTYRKGKKLKSETKEKISNSLKEYYQNPNHKNYWEGKHHSEEVKEKIRMSKLGKENQKKWIPIQQITKEGKIIKEYPSIKQAAIELNLKNGSNISACCKGKIKTAYGFIWKYKET